MEIFAGTYFSETNFREFLKIFTKFAKINFHEIYSKSSFFDIHDFSFFLAEIECFILS